MKARITSIENAITRDPGKRNIFGLARADQLRLAAQSLKLARRVGIVSGFYIPRAGAGETDGPPGAKAVGMALEQLGVKVDYLTDSWNEPLFASLGLIARLDWEGYLADASPTHLVAIERVGRAADGRYRNMRGDDISETTAPLDELFLQANHLGITTIGIGDGGNEIGMGKVFSDAMLNIDRGAKIACVVPTDYCIVAGSSNWGAYGLAGALSVLEGRDLLTPTDEAAREIERMVEKGGAVDGVSCKRTPTVDGLGLGHSMRMLENIRRQITPQLLPPSVASGKSRVIGMLGYGETGVATTSLLVSKGYETFVSDAGAAVVDDAGVASRFQNGGHSIEFLESCDLVVASPGVRPDAEIRDQLHRRGIPVVSALEAAYQLCDRPLVAITGTMGKRSTLEVLASIFEHANRPLTIGGNKGKPLAELLQDSSEAGLIALAVSSFQLETVVRFRPHIAAILNIREEHLDRHRSVAEYLRIKSRIFMNHEADDVLIINQDDERVRTLTSKHQGRTLSVSRKDRVDRGAWIEDGELMIDLGDGVERIGSIEAEYPENVLAASLIARLHGLASESIHRALTCRS